MSLNDVWCIRISFLLDFVVDIDHILIETVFSQLFALPKPPFPELYYAGIFIDLFKAQHSIIPIVCISWYICPCSLGIFC
jgi:hypothetical protein